MFRCQPVSSQRAVRVSTLSKPPVTDNEPESSLQDVGGLRRCKDSNPENSQAASLGTMILGAFHRELEVRPDSH
jgi:hypothetical protein